MTQVMVYTLPILMYLLSIMSEHRPLKVAWAAVACLQILNIFPTFNHSVCCILTSVFIYLPLDIPQYRFALTGRVLPQSQTNNIVLVCLALVLILLNVYSNPNPHYKQEPDRRTGALVRKVTMKRQFN